MPNVTRLSPATRRSLQVGAVVCYGIALYLVATAFLMFARLPMDVGSGGANVFGWWLRFALAIPFFVVGGLMGRFGFATPVSEIMATETSGAMEVSAEAAGRGWATGAGGTAASAGMIRVRCRSCGFLETEDARLCSRCGATV